MVKCLKCGINFDKCKPTKRGWRYNKKGRIQKYCCSRCDYKFVKAGIAYRMRQPRWKILKAIELRDKGLSLAQIAKEIGGVSRQTILKWLQNRRRLKNKFVVVKVRIQKHLREGKSVKEHDSKMQIKI